jgi:hypothetical protein
MERSDGIFSKIFYFVIYRRTNKHIRSIFSFLEILIFKVAKLSYNSACTQDIECENANNNNNNNCFNNNACINYINFINNNWNNQCQRQQLICRNGFCE